MPVRHKGLNKHGFSKRGDAPGLPRNTSNTFTIPGESEEPNQEIGGFSWLGECEDEAEAAVPFGTWAPDKKRVGAIARKVGVMNMWDARGVKITCTVVQIDDCEVVNVKKMLSGRGRPRVNMQLGAVPANPKRMRKSQLCYFRKHQVAPKRKLAEFPVAEDAVLPIGTKIDARHFVPGQYVDVVGTSRGKGFSGVMQRWGFAGQAATHGVSLTHRALGSTGACQDPGRVWKGKKMAGRSGSRQCTFTNMLVYKVDTARNLLFIQGSVPGAVETTMKIMDARKKEWNPDFPPPFPTYEPQPGDEEVDEIIMDVSHLDNPFG